ncbi:hypothetical protein NQ166_00725 [Microbacterium sp. zg.Y1090]|uniref:hypothetical protein n=1 Tax=Microbacterium TaxID=33882 RepID=UPI00214C9F02|nr:MULTISPECIES: hypothetical protein [unclassified Microbacterium]MCR2812845.1 hypothetical protein [Microbacterium sp. zg.Y1084]MCR2817352.1 hypothetical protein [Microbacterium sp. zg.Y1090]MDL5485989.1 hypothetical protein [Microbacterium sp. zg-Y1211]WIM29161.1 hypothetical protein QNO26_04485 [Microbacterium sp. zg-Y1090]
MRDALAWVDEAVITVVGPRSFAGELGLLNGQRAFLSARATGPAACAGCRAAICAGC